MLAEEGKDHVEVDETLWSHGEFLYKDMELFALGCEGLRQVFYAFCVGTNPLPDA